MKKLFNTFKKNRINIIKLLFSFLATAGIVGFYEINLNLTQFSNNFMNIIIFFSLTMMYFKLPKIQKKEKVYAAIFSSFLGVILIVGAQLEFYSEILWNIITSLKFICLAFALFPFICYLLFFINKFKSNHFDNINQKKLHIISFFIIFILNLLVFLAIYPGEYGYDAGYQIMQILEKVPLTSHFSILYSYILTSFVNLGKSLFNSYQIGFALYCFTQMTFLCYVATKITMFCIKKTNNIYFYLFTLLFFGVFPLYTVMALSSSQDPIFAGLFALIVLNIIELIENKNYYKNIYKPISLIILILLFCMIRNNGFYCILISIPFILFLKNKKLLTLLLIIIPLFIYKIYTGPIFDILNIKKTDTFNEMLSIPSQQLARVYNYNKNAFTKKELKKLNYYYTDLSKFDYYIYNQSISDQSKGVINNDLISKNIAGYIKLWTSVGIKDPENYIEAFLLNNLGFWYPNKNYYDPRMYHPYIEYEMMDGPKWNEKYLDIKRNSKFPLYDNVLNKTLTNNAWKRIPVISTFFTTGLYFILFTFLIGIIIIRKQFKYLFPIGVILGLYTTLFLSPVSLFRYCFPIVIIIPIILCQILTLKNNKED